MSRNCVQKSLEIIHEELFWKNLETETNTELTLCLVSVTVTRWKDREIDQKKMRHLDHLHYYVYGLNLLLASVLNICKAFKFKSLKILLMVISFSSYTVPVWSQPRLWSLEVRSSFWLQSVLHFASFLRSWATCISPELERMWLTMKFTGWFMNRWIRSPYLVLGPVLSSVDQGTMKALRELLFQWAELANKHRAIWICLLISNKGEHHQTVKIVEIWGNVRE